MLALYTYQRRSEERWNGGEDEEPEGREQAGREEAEKGEVGGKIGTERKTQEVYKHIKGRAENTRTSVTNFQLHYA